LSSRFTILLMAVFYPLWLAAGLLDYLLHRRSRIEMTSGRKESWFHVLQFALLGVAVLLVAFLEFTPLVFAAALACVVAHTLLAHADITYTEGLRRISPLEQLVHGFLVVLPLAAAAILAAMHWGDLGSLPWALQPRDPPLPWRATAIFVGSFFALGGLPIVEELLRTSSRFRHHQVKDRDQGREGHDSQRNPPAQVAPVGGRQGRLAACGVAGHVTHAYLHPDDRQPGEARHDEKRE
jgi:hypothetical protein